MNSPKVSVIVPIYNAKSTIRKCLDSLAGQTMSGWEVILVNDGSKDSSGGICDEYAEKGEVHSKGKGYFKVIHQENRGVSAARQAGLDAAQGEYVIHADPDDWVEPEMLEELYTAAKAHNSDMVICDFIFDNGKISRCRSQEPTSLQPKVVMNDMFGKIHGSCCNKLVKKECIKRSRAIFPSGINYCEDVLFNVQLLKNKIHINYIAKAFYHYVQSDASLTNHYTQKTLESQKKFVDYLLSLLPDHSYPIIKSKLLVKKLAFRHSLLTNKELLKLYPEIKSTDDQSKLLKWMYDSAFNGRAFFANILLRAYKFLHR